MTLKKKKKTLLIIPKACLSEAISASRAQWGKDIFGLAKVSSFCAPVPGQLHAAFPFSVSFLSLLLYLQFL